MPNYLLDVNVLVAHAILDHEHHHAVVDGLGKRSAKGWRFAVCPIVELGLIRNVMRMGGLSIQEARRLLQNEHINLNLRFVPDSCGANSLPNWIQGYRQTTDAYLLTVAEAHHLHLLTIDKAIPGAESILTHPLE